MGSVGPAPQGSDPVARFLGNNPMMDSPRAFANWSVCFFSRTARNSITGRRGCQLNLRPVQGNRILIWSENQAADLTSDRFEKTDF